MTEITVGDLASAASATSFESIEIALGQVLKPKRNWGLLGLAPNNLYQEPDSLYRVAGFTLSIVEFDDQGRCLQARTNGRAKKDTARVAGSGSNHSYLCPRLETQR